ncbi:MULTISPECIES: hypothetical protein [Bacillus]|uniref:hypothetical protein n=1 Tax=Bacillus TaxID=1386 RepID=UPI00049F1C97|nr:MULTISPECIES: hypothetical protein [Bacillus]KDE21782.1 hypothetical protein EF83_21605 [Bacillus subtilis]MDH3081562.1 hypothetical protein [Bacillus amyloliquefaciens]MDU0074945.1 hypothetical protein [Bacillus sp. IG2]MDU0100655.1 hypothetical protein [Bacillus sp. IS1]MEC2272683.1 hypothetical protein [Bacillus velezensis]
MNAQLFNLESRLDELENEINTQYCELDTNLDALKFNRIELESQLEKFEFSLTNRLQGSISNNCRNDLFNLGYTHSQVDCMSDEEVYAALDKIDEEIHNTDQDYSTGFEDLEKQIIEMKRDYFIDRKERGLGNFDEAWEGEILDLEYEYTVLCLEKGLEPLNHVITWEG